jgi:hypothetical protein
MQNPVEHLALLVRKVLQVLREPPDRKALRVLRAPLVQPV